MKHKMTEKCKISLQNVINISFLHIEKHNQNHADIDIESNRIHLKVTLRAADLQL